MARKKVFAKTEIVLLLSNLNSSDMLAHAVLDVQVNLGILLIQAIMYITLIKSKTNPYM